MKIHILSPIGSFTSVSEAAHAEEHIDWQQSPGPDHIACTLCFAAMELSDHLDLLPHIECSTTPSSRRTPDDRETRGVLTIALTVSPATESGTDSAESYTITTDTDGRGNPIGYSIVGSGPVGTLYGAYELLHRFGFRWFSPDPWDREVPENLDAPVVETTESPSFLLRGFWATDNRGTPEFLLWMARNKLNLWSAEQPEKAFCRKLGIKFTTGGHSIFARFVPPATYFKDHPEWYGLRDGERSPNINGNVGDNICFANSEVRTKIAEALAEDLARGEWKWVDLINVWALDNGAYCTCDACNKLGNPTDQIMLLANDCRKAIVQAQREGKIHREVIVSVPAYHETLGVPENPLPEDFDHDGIVATFFPIERCFVHTFADPACTEINQPLLAFWENWTRNSDNPFHGSMLVGEYYNVSAFASLAIPAVRTMSADIPYYYRSGARLMHYMHVGTALWGSLSLTNTQFAAMLWNHELDTEAFVADYFLKRFRSNAEALSLAYRLLEDAMMNAKPLKHYAGMKRETLRSTIAAQPVSEVQATEAGGGHGTSAADFEEQLFTTRHLHYDERSPSTDSGPSLVQTMDLLHQTGRLLDDELLYCEDPLVRERLLADIRRFRYTEVSVRFTYYAVRLRMFEANGDTASARLEAEALRNTGEALRREEKMPKLKFGPEQEDWHGYLRNGLSATWLNAFYTETMVRYELETPTEEATDGEVL